MDHSDILKPMTAGPFRLQYLQIPQKLVVGRLLSYWEYNFSGVVLNFRGYYRDKEITTSFRGKTSLVEHLNAHPGDFISLQ